MTPVKTRLLICLLTVIPALMGPFLGIAARRYDLVGANPQTLFGLGILAGICLCGIALGLWQGFKAMRPGSPARPTT
jgi:hypothetical protein